MFQEGFSLNGGWDGGDHLLLPVRPAALPVTPVHSSRTVQTGGTGNPLNLPSPCKPPPLKIIPQTPPQTAPSANNNNNKTATGFQPLPVCDQRIKNKLPAKLSLRHKTNLSKQTSPRSCDGATDYFTVRLFPSCFHPLFRLAASDWGSK